MYGVRSAMPMFKALAACPDATVIRPDMKKYTEIGKQVRELMQSATPLVEPISIDEAFLDLSGTEALHGGSPAVTCARLVGRIERQIGITVSIGLSYNKFLAKLASDLDKPRGFAVIGEAEAMDFLAARPVSLIWGVGKALQAKLTADGIRSIGQLRESDEKALMMRYGVIGRRLWRFAHGRDSRVVEPGGAMKSISSETTFNEDIADLEELSRRLWPLCETVSRRMKAKGIAAGTVVLKLKTDRFPPPDPQPEAGGTDAAGGQSVPHRPAPPGRRGGRHPLSADRNRRLGSGGGRSRRSAGPAGSGAGASAQGGRGDRFGPRQAGRRGHRQGPRLYWEIGLIGEAVSPAQQSGESTGSSSSSVARTTKSP